MKRRRGRALRRRYGHFSSDQARLVRAIADDEKALRRLRNEIRAGAVPAVRALDTITELERAIRANRAALVRLRGA